MKFKNIIAALSIISLISIPFTAHAETGTYNGFEYEIRDNVAIITGYTCNSDENITSLEIAEKINHNGTDYTVTGIDELAFGYMENLTSVYLPDNITFEYMNTTAFVTETSIADYISQSMDDDFDETKFLELIAKNMEYNNKKEGWTAQELAEVKEKLNQQAELAGVTEGMDVGEAMVLMIKNRDKMTLSEKTASHFELWIKTIPCSNITAYVRPNTSTSECIKSISEWTLLNVVYTYPSGDANHDGVANVRDCAFIANALANGNPKELPDSSDYNSDGVINVRDAAALAFDLSKNAK